MRAGLPSASPTGSPAGKSCASTTGLRDRAAAAPGARAHLHAARRPPLCQRQPPLFGHALNKVLKDMVVRSQADDGPRRALHPRLGLPRPAHRMEDRSQAYREKGPGQGTPWTWWNSAANARDFAGRAGSTVQREGIQAAGRERGRGEEKPYLTMDYPRRADHRGRVPEVPDVGPGSTRARSRSCGRPWRRPRLAEAEVEYHGPAKTDAVWVAFEVVERGRFHASGRVFS